MGLSKITNLWRLGKNKVTAPEKGSENLSSTEIQQIEDEIRTRFIGCFLGLAIGDAKGMPAESKSPEIADQVADQFDYLAGYLPAGHFTDDTHHATFLAESLAEKAEFDPDDFMKKLSTMELRRGYGPTTFRAIIKYLMNPGEKSGLDSPGNGPAMRVAPLALMYHHDPQLLRQYVENQARLTHDNSMAVAGSMTVAFTIAYMLNHFNQPFDKANYLSELIACIEPINQKLAAALHEDATLAERNGCHVMESVPHAIRIFINNPYDFEKAVTQAIRGGGDADTIAAIVGAISGAFNGHKKIPQMWIERLENSEKGREYIVHLAEKLFELSKSKMKKAV